jgi:hypothetical protein
VEFEKRSFHAISIEAISGDDFGRVTQPLEIVPIRSTTLSFGKINSIRALLKLEQDIGAMIFALKSIEEISRVRGTIVYRVTQPLATVPIRSASSLNFAQLNKSIWFVPCSDWS